MSRSKENAFTLIEILVSIGIAAILAAITILGYGAWRENTTAKVVKSDLSGVRTAMASARNFSNGFPLAPTFSGSSATFKATNDVNITYISGDTKTFCINANSVSLPTIIYHISESDKEAQPGNCT